MLSLPIPVLLILVVVSSWGCALLKGAYAKLAPSDTGRFWWGNLVMAASCLVSLVLYLLLSRGFSEISLFTAILGVLMGVCGMVSTVANIQAFALGPFAYTTVIYAVLAVIIPTLSGLFVGERINGIQGVGILLMLVCLLLSTDWKQQGEQKKASLKWLLTCLLAGTVAGFVGIIQKVHQSSEAHRDEMMSLLILQFLTWTVLSVLPLFKKRPPEPTAASVKQSGRLWAVTAATGVLITFINIWVLFLSGQLPAVVVFPVTQICPMLLSTVSAVFLFRERLSLTRWIGVAIGILAIVLLSGIL